MTFSGTYTQACFDAWINCENLLGDIAVLKNPISKKYSKVVDECAFICMGTFHAFKSRSQNISQMALLCVGICQECAELCGAINDSTFKKCAAACRQCAEVMMAVAFTNLQ